jgi:hypothetical protein
VLQHVAQRQLAKIDAITDHAQTSNDAERNSRAFASLSRILLDIKRLEAPQASTPSESTDEQSIPRDVDELRRELSRKLAALVAGRAGAVPGGS